MHQLGRQRCFELGNPYYCKYDGDGEFYTKELPTGEMFVVAVKILYDNDGNTIGIVDEILSRKDTHI